MLFISHILVFFQDQYESPFIFDKILAIVCFIVRAFLLKCFCDFPTTKKLILEIKWS